MVDEIARASAVEIAEAIRKRRVSCVEVARSCLARAEAVQRTLNCFISIEHDELLRAARAADRTLARGRRLGPLHGVPLAHKDMFYRRGKVSTCGSKILREYRQDVTATVVARLARAGALWLGALHMSEFAANPTGQNAHWGRCRNPWDPERISGGSSSGSAAAVSARACFGSLGSDTGGSIRMPAALCGVVGLRPTSGRVSVFGAMPRAWSHDCVGPIARTVRDCARIVRVIAGADPMDPASSREPVPDYERALRGDIRGVRVGVPEEYFYSHLSADVQACMDASLAVLRSLGARLVSVSVPDMAEAFSHSTVMTDCEASTFHAGWMRTRPGDYSDAVRERLEPGFHVPAPRYIAALRARVRLQAEFLDRVFSRADVVHTPVVAVPTPTAVEADEALSADMRAAVAGLTRNTRPVSYLGFPALSVPAGFTAVGMPAAFQVFGRPFAEALVLRVGHAYQSVTDWHRRMPPV